MLYPNVEELRQEYLKITAEPDFLRLSLISCWRIVNAPAHSILQPDYLRNTILKSIFKREDLNHTEHTN
jgi:tryptophan synthase beta chain